MEKLNEYLETLVSTNGLELRLVPNKKPFIVSADGETEVGSADAAPLLGTQISTMIFPLIPPKARQDLPVKPEIEFVHNHNLGDFSFLVRKSPAGFNVTISPLIPVEAPISEEVFGQTESEPQNFAAPQMPEEILPIDFPTAAAGSSNASSVESGQESFAALPNDPDFSFENMNVSSDTEIIKTMIYTPPENVAAGVSANLSNEAYKPLSIFQNDRSQTVGSTPDTDILLAALKTISPNYQPPTPPPQTPPMAVAMTPIEANPQSRNRMDDLLRQLAETGASDLHLSVNIPPMVRRNGKIQMLDAGETAALTRDSVKDLLTSIMPLRNQQEFALHRDTDFAYEIENFARFRANIFMDRKGMGGVFRIIPSEILSAEQIGLSEAVLNLCSLPEGLIIVAGAPGAGKSTTLAALIDRINQTREEHIMTIEDPIEFVHDHKKCLVNQREVGSHTDSFKNALRAALRENPDILLIGEMRDSELISSAIEIAATGHLVFGSMNAATAASAVERIIDRFPADCRHQIRARLSESLKGVIAQTLVPKKDGEGSVAAIEVLIVTPEVGDLIREGKTSQIAAAMQNGKAQGIIMLNDALLNLALLDLVEPRELYLKAVDKTNFETLLKRNKLKI